jgi:imidazoleglycerol phosphate dehydratase HisB
MMEKLRKVEVQRKTSETEVLLQLNLDGTGSHQIDTEIPFLSHMLTLLSLHSLCDLKVTARGDVEVDDHHTVEDIGICFGQALDQALGEKRGIRRYGAATIPMDEALSRVVIDLSGRSVLVMKDGQTWTPAASTSSSMIGVINNIAYCFSLILLCFLALQTQLCQFLQQFYQ